MKKTERILIVEDEPDWQEEMAEVLAGYDILTAGSVGEACRCIEDADLTIDLVILDLGLSKVTGINSGLTVLACLQDHRSEVPCVIFTGRELPMRKAAQLFQQYHVFEGLEKPADMPRLASVVHTALKQSKTKTRQKSELPVDEPGGRGKNRQVLPNHHGLIIGVGNYEHPRFANLPATERDAQALIDVLTDPAYGGYPPENVHAITGPEATAANIGAAMEFLSHASTPDATVLIYFSGHGGRIYEHENWHTYLCPREANPDDLSNTAIPSDQFSAALSAIPARRMIVILDACHAGGSAEIKAANGARIWKSGLPEYYYDALSQGSGRVVIASSKADQYSHVRPQGDLSLFTYCLLEALKGEAAIRGDGMVHILDVFHYVNESVQANEPEQTPILKANDLDMNFPMAAVPGDLSMALKTSQAAPEIETIRKEIVNDPIAGAQALSEYLASHSDLEARRNEVDLKRSQLQAIQHELDLFGPDPGKVAEKNRAVFYLLRICLELKQSEG
ncbi:MAG: caspase family protein [Anaerolineae bacterium]|nr:caspase family protein [Anaerolineae bacterium]